VSALVLVSLAACSYPTKHFAADDGGTTGDASDGGSATIDAATGPFRCAGNGFPTTAPSSVQVAGTVMTYSTFPFSQPLANAPVSLYASGDPSVPKEQVSTDANGAFTLPIQTSLTAWDGFLVFSDGAGGSTKYHPSRPINEDLVNVKGQVFKPADLQTLYSKYAIAYDAGLEFVVIHVVDCDGNALADATVKLTDASGDTGTLMYATVGSPDPNATATDYLGIVTVFNVPPGMVQFDATTIDGRHLHTYNYNIGSGDVTSLVMQP
jgi:hypothetical protein